MKDFPVNYVELEDGIFDVVRAGKRTLPYSNFNFQVVTESPRVEFDGRLLTETDLLQEQL